MDTQAHTTQDAAIAQVRARYERGDISFEAFKRALDALILARTPTEFDAILRELPPSPMTALAALDRVPAPVAPPMFDLGGGEVERISAIMGNTKKLTRPWRLGERTQVSAVMGDVKLDLNLAALPRHAVLHVSATMASITLYVPRTARVRVRASSFLGAIDALGERHDGIVTSSYEEQLPSDGGEDVTLDIRASTVMGEIKIISTDGPTVSWTELAHAALRGVADGIRRGLQSGTSPE